MKHALLTPLILSALLAGCADQERDRAYDMRFAADTGSHETGHGAALPAWWRHSGGGPGSAPPGEDAGGAAAGARDPLRHERHVYAEGLERILLSNGVSAGVLVYEGKAEPTPTLIFVGRFSREFVHRALTTGAVLKRARELGFRSIEFFDRGPDRHYQFVLSKTGPLPKCAAYNRLCL